MPYNILIDVLPSSPHVPSPGLWALATASSLLGLGVILLAIAGAVADRRIRLMQRLTHSNLTGVFVVVWLIAFAVYLTGMYTGQPVSLLGNAPMAVIHAFGTFVLASDVSAITQPYVNDWVFMAAFSMAHFLAAAVSMLFVIKHFGYDIMSRARLAAAARWQRPRATTYIFWGFNDAVYSLACDIRRHHGDDDSYRIVVVDRPRDDDEGNTGILGRLVPSMSMSDAQLERLQELECLSTVAHDDTNMGKSLQRLIKAKASEQLHIFIPGEEEKTNLRCATALAASDLLTQWAAAAHRRKATIYCHASSNALNRVIEDTPRPRGLKVRLIDTSHLAVEMLKGRKEVLPVNYVEVEDDATVSSPFNSMIIGCGEVGREALHYVYEYAAFLAPASDDRRSPFTCHVVDSNASLCKGRIKAEAPGLADDSSITFDCADCRSEQFINSLQKRISSLHYIVVATGDDNLNMATALLCYKMAQRYRTDMERLCILTHVRDDADGRYGTVADHYNRLYHAQRHAADNLMHQNTVTSQQKCWGPLYLFGLESDIYTYAAIVDNSLLQKARQFKARYDLSLPVSYRSTWDDEEAELLQTAPGQWQGYAPTLSALGRLRRVQSQNMANSQHALTKRLLATYALGEEVLSRLPLLGLRRTNGAVTYTMADGTKTPDDIIKMLDVLARTEHLRWMAAHILLGYLPADGVATKDELRLMHGCLVPWESLTTTLQAYDYNVVDVSLDINSHTDE